jgi:adenine-specific DNA-methyltransferase
MNLDQQKEKSLLKRISELEAEIKKTKKQKKYGLVWEEKPEKIVVDCQKNVPILKMKEGDKNILPVIKNNNHDDDNILIEGDNYHALSVLNYTHKGKIDVIYIDPPYNTGAKDWKYNNDYVDENDAYRHSKWISMMYNRLSAAKRLLKDDGILICAIDDNELSTLSLLFDDLFSEKIKNTVVIVNNPHGVSRSGFSRTHEYALFLLNQGQVVNKKPAPEDLRNINLRRSGNNSLREDSPTMFYPIFVNKKSLSVIGAGDVPKNDFHPKSYVIDKGDYYEVWPVDVKGIEKNWYYSKRRVQENGSSELNCRFIKNQLQISFHHSNNSEQTYKTVWVGSEYDAGAYGATLVKEVTKNNFPFPKSINTVLDCLKAVVKSDKAIILDFFAGSGTTGQAVLEMNKIDGGNRKFILCTNNENKICEDITYQRIKHIMCGYKNNKGELFEGLGGNLRYYKTDLVDIEKLHHTPDSAKIKLTYQTGEMIALRENTLNEVEKNEWWQIFEGLDKTTAIYFKEDKEKLQALVDKLEKTKQPSALYIFSWGKNEYKSEYSSNNIRVEDIPEPILEVYKEINRL